MGRVPIVVTLNSLDKEALVEILLKPKNSLVKQYQKLFEMDQVKLEFTEASLLAIAEEAIKRNTGARGLRSILEDIMKEVMFDVPSDETIEKVVIHGDTIKTKAPEIIYRKETEETA